MFIELTGAVGYVSTSFEVRDRGMCDKRYVPEREHHGRNNEVPRPREERSLKHSDLPSRHDEKTVKPPVYPSDQMYTGKERVSED